jgi:hypothetical protein
MRMAEPRGFWSRNVTPHLRLGPVLFVLLAALTAYLACWEPEIFFSRFGPEVDTRIGFIINGFAPFTFGIAVWAAFAYVRLWRIQFRSPTKMGRILLGLLALPLAGAVFTGASLSYPAIYFLPMFIRSFIPFGWFGW